MAAVDLSNLGALPEPEMMVSHVTLGRTVEPEPIEIPVSLKIDPTKTIDVKNFVPSEAVLDALAEMEMLSLSSSQAAPEVNREGTTISIRYD